MSYSGNYFLVATFLLGLLSIIFYYLGLIKNKEVYFKISFVQRVIQLLILVMSIIILLLSILDNNFSLEYVVNYSHTSIPIMYKIPVLWRGFSGFLLIIVFIFSVVSLIETLRLSSKGVKYNSIVDLLMLIYLTILIFILIFLSPFNELEYLPYQGNGIDGHLQNINIYTYPIALILFITTFSILNIHCITALYTKDVSVYWLRRVKVWIYLSWLSSILVLISKGYWAYTRYSWDRFWYLSNVELIWFISILLLTSIIHLSIIYEKREKLQEYFFILLLLSFESIIFAIYITKNNFPYYIYGFNWHMIDYIFLTYMVVFPIIYFFLYKRNFKKIGMCNSIIFTSIERGLITLVFIMLFISIGIIVGLTYNFINSYSFTSESIISLEYYQILLFIGSTIILLFMELHLLTTILKFKNKVDIKYLYLFLAIVFIIILFILKYFFKNYILYFLYIFCLLTLITLLVRFVMIAYNYGWKSLIFEVKRYSSIIIHIGFIVFFLGFITSVLLYWQREVVLTKGEDIKIDSYKVTVIDVKKFYNENYISLMLKVKISTEDSNMYIYPEIRSYQDQSYKNIAEIKSITTGFTQIQFAFVKYNTINGRITLLVMYHPLILLIIVGLVTMFLGLFITIGSKEKE